MESVLLKDGETSIKTTDAELIIYFKNKRRTHWHNLVVFLITASILLLSFKFGIELLIPAIIGGIVILSLHQVTELNFNKKNKKLVRQYSFFGKVLKSKILLNNYEMVNYIIKYDTQSAGETNVTGYFFTTTLRKETIYLYVFKSLEDAKCAVEIINKELNLIDNQIDVKN